MARPRKFDESTVVENIKNLFWEKGFEGTSYADLMAVSGLHKGSLYQAFGDKRALYLKALGAYDNMEVDGAVQLLTRGKNGGKQIAILLGMVIDAVAKGNDRRGCFLCNAAVDQAPYEPQTEKAVKAGFTKMNDAFLQALSDVDDVKTRKKLAAEAMAVYFGMRVMAKSGVPIKMLRHARESFLATLETQRKP